MGRAPTMWSNHAGVQPLGNLLYEQGGLVAGRKSRARTLGAFAVLSDELICRLMPFLTPDDLAKFCQVSSGCRAFAMDEDLWRAAVFSEFGISFLFAKSWRKTYIRARLAKNPEAVSSRDRQNAAINWHTNCIPFYSDVLFHKWRCLYAMIQPKWTEFDNATRVSPATMSPDMFREQFEETGIPVVIRDVVNKWPAFNKWKIDYLIAKYAKTKFHAGGFEFPLQDYFTYCYGVHELDDQTLTIFDKKFADKAPEMATDYEVPSYFDEDLFSVFGDSMRPDYRWLIIGPERSGSSFHKDPNCTSAWNGVVTGRKKWMLFPPKFPPPGVIPSDDGGNVTGPVSVMEWFLNYYDAAHEYGKSVGAIECVVSAGEMMFIPAGWWHVVLNLDFTIAITQNYASSANVVSVAKWLKYKPEQISGCASEKQKLYISSNFARLVAEKRTDLRRRLRASRILSAEDGAVFLPETDDEDSESSYDEDLSVSEDIGQDGLKKGKTGHAVSKGGHMNGNGVEAGNIAIASRLPAMPVSKEENGSRITCHDVVEATDKPAAKEKSFDGVQKEDTAARKDSLNATESANESAGKIMCRGEVSKVNTATKEYADRTESAGEAAANLLRVDGVAKGGNCAKECTDANESNVEPAAKKPRIGLWQSLKQKTSKHEAAELDSGSTNEKFSFDFQV